MSETVHYRGTAVLISKGEQAEIDAKIILAEKGEIEKPNYYKTWVEYLSDEFYNDYYYHEPTESLYEIDYKEIDPYEDIIKAHYINLTNTKIGFELKYYNGGAGFNECLEEAINKLENE